MFVHDNETVGIVRGISKIVASLVGVRTGLPAIRILANAASMNVPLLLCLVIAAFSFERLHASSFYVDADGGNDTKSGKSPAEAWASLEKVSSQKFKAGDQILLKCGDTFRGKLALVKVAGSSQQPIVIASYGEGDPPVIDAAGYRAGIHLANCEHFEVRDLEITADGDAPVDDADPKERYGVLANTWGDGASHGLLLKNLHIHSIYPHEPTEHEGTNPTTYVGTAIRVSGTKKTPSKDVRIEDCRIENTGFAVLQAVWTSHLQVLNNHMKDIGGPAMVPSHCDDLVVRGNTVDGSGAFTDQRMHGRGSGIWPVYCERVLIEKNRFMHARGRYDSCGAHIDIGNRNVVVQYNLSLDNEGGFAEILGENVNCTYRYNISINDGARVQDKKRKSGDGHAILFSGHNGTKNRSGPTNCYVYNNTIYVKRGQHCSFSIEDTTRGVMLANNLFYVEGKAEDGTPSWWGKYQPGIEDTVFWTNNLYQKRGIFPKEWRFRETGPIVDDPHLANPGGLNPEDYIPATDSPVKDAGIEITKIPGDDIGLELGFAVDKDFFGNPIVGLPDIGAVEVSNSSATTKDGMATVDVAQSIKLGQKDEDYTLTDTEGRTIDGRLLHVDKDYVYVRLGNNRSYAIPLKILDSDTQNLLAAWEQKFGTPLTDQQSDYLKSLRNQAEKH